PAGRRGLGVAHHAPRDCLWGGAARRGGAVVAPDPRADAGGRRSALPLVYRDPQRVGLGDLHRGGTAAGTAVLAEALTWRQTNRRMKASAVLATPPVTRDSFSSVTR